MHLYNEAKAIADQAWAETGNAEEALEFAQQVVDYHEVSIYHHAAIKFCAELDTSRGEEFLEDCGGIARDGDSFGSIACRIAYATLLCAVEDCLFEIEVDLEAAA